MAFFQGSIRSAELAMDTQINVILPWDRPAGNQKNPCKTLYLLHGLSGNSTAWTRNSRVELYAREYGIAVVMPEVQRSFYRDMHYGLKYFSYVTEELPQLCNKLFGLDQSRENNYVAGLSMGGYGAIKCGLTYPGKYAGCASFSGVLDIKYILKDPINNQTHDELVGLLGPELEVLEGDDLFSLAEKASKQSELPDMLITCGKQDFLYQTNANFIQCIDKLNLDYTYREWDGGHEWEFWDKSIQMALDFFIEK